MNKLKILKGLATLILGAVFGVMGSELIDYLKGQPIEKISQKIDANNESAKENQKKLLAEIESLKSIPNLPKTSLQIINNIQNISSDLSVNIDTINQYGSFISDNLLTSIAFEESAGINTLPDFLTPIHKGISLCSNKTTFSVLSENSKNNIIKINLGRHSYYLNVGKEQTFNVNNKKGMISYLGKYGMNFSFRLVCDY